MWTQAWKGGVATHYAHHIIVIVTDPLVHPAFLRTHQSCRDKTKSKDRWNTVIM